jgi:uncharacterized coiled-coil protein SlyX
MEITITTCIRISEENRKQVRYLIEKLAEVDAMTSEDKNMIWEMAGALTDQ